MSTLDIVLRLVEQLARVTELFTEPLPDVWIETPGGGQANSNSDSFISWILMYCTFASLKALDTALGLTGRRFGQAQKKADVKRGTEYTEHKNASIESMRASARANGDELALRFLDDVLRSGQKIDDPADAYNLARAADDQPPPPTPDVVLVPKKRKPLKEKVAVAVAKAPVVSRGSKRPHDSLLSSSDDEPHAKRRKHDSLLSSSSED